MQDGIDSLISKHFRVDVYRVIVCGTLSNKMSDYWYSNKTSHSYSAFRLTDDSIQVLNAKIVINR